MYCFGERHLYAVRCHHLAVRQLLCNALIQIVTLCFHRNHAQKQGEHDN